MERQPLRIYREQDGNNAGAGRVSAFEPRSWYCGVVSFCSRGAGAEGKIISEKRIDDEMVLAELRAPGSCCGVRR